MYEITVDGDSVVVPVTAIMDAWAASSPQVVADAIALAVDAYIEVLSIPPVTVRRIW